MSLAILLLGPPGAGKGTHASLLSAELQIPHISTGELFREHIRSGSPLGLRAQEFMGQGHLVSDDLVLTMLFERVAKGDCSRGYILDGFPRTLAQAEALAKHLINSRLFVLYFNVPNAVLMERITGRLVCQECARSYHRCYAPPQRIGLCDSCLGALYTREDDREEVFCKRLEVYRLQTAPLLNFYADMLHEIDGAGSKDSIFEQVLTALLMPLGQGGE